MMFIIILLLYFINILTMFYKHIQTVMYMQTSAIGRAQGLAFSVYGETLIVMVQNFILIMMIYSYSKAGAHGIVEKLFVFSFFIGYAFVLFDPMDKGFLQKEHYKLISGSTIFISK